MQPARHGRNGRNNRNAQRPALIAHRGLPTQFPENSLLGFENAVGAGAAFIELDVQLGADGVPVLYHDRDLLRISGREGAVHEYTAAQLARFRAIDYTRFGYRFAQTPIARLDEFIHFLGDHPGVTAFVEIKRISVEHFGVQAVVDTILEHLQPAEQQCVVISYSLDALEVVRTRAQLEIGVVLDQWREQKSRRLREIHPEYLFCNVKGLPRWGRLRSSCRQLAVFQTDNPDTAIKLARRGAGFVETDTFVELQLALNTGWN